MFEQLGDIFDQGGWVMNAIFLTSLLAWGMIIWEWLCLKEQTRGGWNWIEQAINDIDHERAITFSEHARASHHNLIGQLIRTGLKKNSHDREGFESQIMPLIRAKAVRLEQPLRMIAVLGASMPLLGLLGTVLGMTQTFSALTAQNIPQVDALAGGISQALVTTQAGLIVAVPVVLIHGVLSFRVRRYVETVSMMIKRIESVVCYD